MAKAGWQNILLAIVLGVISSLFSLVVLSFFNKIPVVILIFVGLIISILAILTLVFLILGIVLIVVNEVDSWRGVIHVDEKERIKVLKSFDLEKISKKYENINYEIAMDKDKMSQWTIEVVSEITEQKIKITKNDLNISYIGTETVYIGATPNAEFIFGTLALKINWAK